MDRYKEITKVKRIKRKIGLAFWISIIAILFAACGKEDQKNSETLLFQYDGSKIYMNEAWIYAKTIQSQYEAWYGSSVWDYQVSDENGQKTTMEEVTKKDMITQIKMTKVLSNKAKQDGITLSAEERKKIQDNAKSFMDSVSGDEIEKTGITEEILIQVYEENALADKVYDQIKKEANITISDEECRQYKTYNLLFETFDYNENGQRSEYNNKKKAEQKKKAEEAYKRIQAGETDLEVLATEYSATRSSEYTCGDDGNTAQIYIDTIKTMKKDEISPIVESELGYHIIKMLDPNDKEAMEQKRKILLEEAESDYFHEKYAEMTKEMEEKWSFERDVNQSAYEEIIFCQNLEEDTEETTEENPTTEAVSNTAEAATEKDSKAKAASNTTEAA